MVQGATDPEGAAPVMREMEAYWRREVDRRRREPNDGLLSEIINSEYDGTLILRNTLVAHSSTGSNCTGEITDGGGNLSYPDASCPGINADPLLGPLQDNGGPTWTMALGPGSAAIDAANDTTCASDPVNNLDQRGIVRPQGAHCDIGALEQLRTWLPILVVTTSP